MKKIHILGLFLLIFSFFAVFFPNTTHAEIEGYNAKVECLVSAIEADDPTETSSYNAATRTLTMDYSEFLNGGIIKLTASLVSEQENENLDAVVSPIYCWTIDKVIVSQSNTLEFVSNYNIDNIAKQQIRIGSTRVLLTISDATSTGQTTTDVTINITDNNSKLSMKIANSEYPNALDNEVTDLHFFANIPTTSKLVSYTWQLKTPKGTTYLTASTTYSYTFSRMAMLGSYGYGEYKLIAIGRDEKTDTTYYSKIFSLNIIPNSKLEITPETHQLVIQQVENSLTNIEAFKYTLTSADNLIPENIYWYINGYKVATGLTFIYEPTTRAEYKLAVKYLANENGVPLELVEQLKVNPKTTGMEYMYITIGTVVAVLSVILFISIKVSNKKRDVIW